MKKILVFLLLMASQFTAFVNITYASATDCLIDDFRECQQYQCDVNIPNVGVVPYCCPTNTDCFDKLNEQNDTSEDAVEVGRGLQRFEGDPNIELKEGISIENLNALNPLIIGNEDNPNVLQRQSNLFELTSPSGLINRALRYLFPFAGLVLFVMTVWGGFEILSTSATKKSVDAGKQRVQAAIIGFIMLFTAYWIMMIVEAVFSVKILSG